MSKFQIGRHVSFVYAGSAAVGEITAIHEGDGVDCEDAYSVEFANISTERVTRTERDIEAAPPPRDVIMEEELIGLCAAIKRHYEGDEQDLDVIVGIIADRLGLEAAIDQMATDWNEPYETK